MTLNEFFAQFKVGDTVNVSAGGGVFVPFTGEIVGFIDQYAIVEDEGNPLEVDFFQMEKPDSNLKLDFSDMRCKVVEK